jgi:hypothetical protein
MATEGLRPTAIAERLETPQIPSSDFGYSRTQQPGDVAEAPKPPLGCGEGNDIIALNGGCAGQLSGSQSAWNGALEQVMDVRSCSCRFGCVYVMGSVTSRYMTVYRVVPVLTSTEKSSPSSPLTMAQRCAGPVRLERRDEAETALKWLEERDGQHNAADIGSRPRLIRRPSRGFPLAVRT